MQVTKQNFKISNLLTVTSLQVAKTGPDARLQRPLLCELPGPVGASGKGEVLSTENGPAEGWECRKDVIVGKGKVSPNPKILTVRHCPVPAGHRPHGRCIRCSPKGLEIEYCGQVCFLFIIYLFSHLF